MLILNTWTLPWSNADKLWLNLKDRICNVHWKEFRFKCYLRENLTGTKILFHHLNNTPLVVYQSSLSPATLLLKCIYFRRQGKAYVKQCTTNIYNTRMKVARLQKLYQHNSQIILNFNLINRTVFDGFYYLTGMVQRYHDIYSWFI
jgi:hypothetical protein